MANAGLLQILAQGPQVSGVERFQQGQQRGFQLQDILDQRDARQFIPGAVQGDKAALAQLLGLSPEVGLQVSGNLERAADRRNDMDWRKSESERAQKNADRAYQLDVQQFGQQVANQNWQRRLEEQRLAGSTQPRAPNGYRFTANGDLEAIPGGPADPRVKASQGAGGVTTKMRNDAVSVDQAYRNLDTALGDYQALVQKTGVSMLPGQENDAVQQARTNLQLQLKELYNLGVLNGPDLSLMQNMIFDPQTSILDPIGSAAKVYGAMNLPGGEKVGDRATKSIGQLRGMLKTIRDNKTKGILDDKGQFVGGSEQPAAQGFNEGDYFGSEVDIPEGAVVVDDDGAAYQKINGQLVPVQ